MINYKILLSLFFIFLFNQLNSQTFTNVQARQEGLEIIITYDLSEELNTRYEVLLGVSTDGGNTYQIIKDAYGDVGKNITPGKNKNIYMVVTDDLGGINAKFKVGIINDFPPPGMVFIEGGTFQMGSENGENDEKPVHTVTVDDFFMDITEVTQLEYQKVMGSNPSYFKCDDCPVENVTWFEANEYAKKVGKRLPTEAEWEYAARGGKFSKGFKYSGSNNIDEVAWFNGNSNRKTHRVAEKKPNELGLYDLSGNVWEWCSDWYSENYYYESPENNPLDPDYASNRVLRGGSWNNFGGNCRIGNRFGDFPVYRGIINGFRCVRNW